MSVFEELEVDKLSDTSFRSKHFLSKPSPALKGVYGGNLAAQALLVAIRSSGEGFSPHSLHSYFVRAGSDSVLFDWNVDKISDGRNFCNRIVTALQHGEVKYIANISLTKKNSVKEHRQKYDAWKKWEAEHKDDVDDDSEEEAMDRVGKPVSFGTSYPRWLKEEGTQIDSLPITVKSDGRSILHKLPPQMENLSITKSEDSLLPTERQLSFFVKWGKQSDANESKNVEESKIKEFKYLGLAFLSDSVFLTTMGRVLRIDPHTIKKDKYDTVSLDHIIHFHDSDFDPTEWMAFGFRALNYSNERVLLEGGMFNKDGKHVASIMQEGILKLGKSAEVAKL